jgi:Cof subfamily protein (haloacid dehalogenase superfamily)
MVELIAIDIDGTLLTSEKTVTDRTRRVLRAIKNLNTKIVLASARPPRSVAKVYKLLGFDDCVICYNGALIYDPPNKSILAHHPIPLRTAKSVIMMSRKTYPDVLISVEVLDHWFTDRVSKDYQTEVAKQFVPDKLGPIESWLTSDVTKILLLGEQKSLSEIRKVLRTKLSRRLSSTQSESNILQIMSAGVSKGKALKFVCEHYGVPLQRTIAIGDAPNDIDMLQAAGIGIAMADADDTVKESADYITSTNDADGVAEALEKFAL